MKPFLAVFLLLSLVLTSSFVQSTMAYTSPPPPPTPSFCDTKCGERCAKAGYKERCMKFCNICCQKCQCVPSGTYGNKSECPCYRDLKNSKGNSKCP